MPYTIVDRQDEDGHSWALASATCDLNDPEDELIAETATLVRISYGEAEILADAEALGNPEIAGGIYNTDHLVAAIRLGLPDPAAEGNKPPALTTYRSQSAEMVAKAALRAAYGFEYPAAPQEAALNANQPILGFDGWGLLITRDGFNTLVLIQVKGTDEEACPPAVAAQLADECRRVPRDRSALARGLSVLIRLLRNHPHQMIVTGMLEMLGREELPPIHVAPAIIRGMSQGNIEDLRPVRDVADQFDPATARGIVVMIGTPLSDFGGEVMRKAREVL